ncbi:MAG: recombinase family protein [Nitrososphaerota archaeon]|nr:recombinase family protein [Nitrososphaerota archaeon]
MKPDERYPTGTAAKMLGISFLTLKRWIYSGKVNAQKNIAGRWSVPESEINRLLGVKKQEGKRAILYARVSSHEQKDHLKRQIERLRRYAADKGYESGGRNCVCPNNMIDSLLTIF